MLEIYNDRLHIQYAVNVIDVIDVRATDRLFLSVDWSTIGNRQAELSLPLTKLMYRWIIARYRVGNTVPLIIASRGKVD